MKKLKKLKVIELKKAFLVANFVIEPIGVVIHRPIKSHHPSIID